MILGDSTTRAAPEPRRGKDKNMKKTLVLLCLCCLLPVTAFAGSTRESLQARIDAAKAVLDEIMATPDNSIPMDILDQATCVGVIPGIWAGGGNLPHRPRLERAGIHSHGRRLVRLPDRRPVH